MHSPAHLLLTLQCNVSLLLHSQLAMQQSLRKTENLTSMLILAKNHPSVPIAKERFGLFYSHGFFSNGLTFFKELGRRMTMATVENRKAHLFQRLSVAVQHLNRVLLRCSLGATLLQ